MIIYHLFGALAQLVAHNTGSVGVRSSNLLCSTSKPGITLTVVPGFDFWIIVDSELLTRECLPVAVEGGAKEAVTQWVICRKQKRPERVLPCAVREAGIPPAVRARFLAEASSGLQRKQGTLR